MISDDGNGKRSSLEVVFPLGESKGDHKQFPVVNIVVSFGEGEHFGEVGIGIKVTVDILLHNNGSCCKERGVGHEGERTRGVRDGEDRGRGENLITMIECTLLERAPYPRLILFGEKGKQGDDVGIV